MEEKLIIDGFNLSHAWEKLSQNTRISIPDMVCQVESHAAQKGNKVTIVFDGTRFKGQLPESKWLRILFSKPGRAADEVLEAYMAGISKEERLHWSLVSDDIALRQMAVGMGLRVKGSAAFIDEWKQSKSASPAPPKAKPFNNPFADRL